MTLCIDTDRACSEIRRVIRLECQALQTLGEKVSETASAAVFAIYACRGRVLVTGMGKTGLIGRKIAATLASTGTPAFFLHPAEAYHGDLGVVTPDDVLLALSNSGETEEVVRLLPHFRRFGVPIVCLTGSRESTLARFSDITIDVGVDCEADPLGVAPTASTTAMLAMGDALAVAVLVKRGFTQEQFSLFHPGGSLGRKLLLLVKDLMHVGEALPLVPVGSSLRDTIYQMTLKRLGAAFVVSKDGRLAGFLSDGDLRRLLEREGNPLCLPVEHIMTNRPKTIAPDALAADALRLMESHAITVLPVVDGAHHPVGALHLHDLVQAGLA
jgi:arabinose-5-phosphate isomerase